MRIDVTTRVDAGRLSRPVAPAMSRCGISARLTITERPAMSRAERRRRAGGPARRPRCEARTSPRVTSWRSRCSAPRRRSPSDPGSGRGCARRRRPSHRRCPCARSHAGRPSPRPELELEAGHRRPHRVPDQVRLDAVGGKGALEDLAAGSRSRFLSRSCSLVLFSNFNGGSFQEPADGVKPARASCSALPAAPVPRSASTPAASPAGGSPPATGSDPRVPTPAAGRVLRAPSSSPVDVASGRFQPSGKHRDVSGFLARPLRLMHRPDAESVGTAGPGPGTTAPAPLAVLDGR